MSSANLGLLLNNRAWEFEIHRGQGWLDDKTCQKYSHFLTEPAEHVNEYLVWLGESFFYAGEGEKRSIVSSRHAQFAEKCEYTRLGLLDAVIMYWDNLPAPHAHEHSEYFGGQHRIQAIGL